VNVIGMKREGRGGGTNGGRDKWQYKNMKKIRIKNQ